MLIEQDSLSECFLNRLFTTDKKQKVLKAVEDYQASEDKKLILNGLFLLSSWIAF